MSLALAAEESVTLVVEVDPKTLFDFPETFGSVNVYGPPEAGCVTNNVPVVPAGGVAANANVLLAAKVTLAFNPDTGVHVMVAPAVNATGIEEYTGAVTVPVMVGLEIVGLVAKTTPPPVPVSSVIADNKLALVGVAKNV